MPPSTEQTLDAPAPRTGSAAATSSPARAPSPPPAGPPRRPEAAGAHRPLDRADVTPRASSGAAAAGSAWRAAPAGAAPDRLSAIALEMLSHLPHGLLATTAARFPHVIDGLARNWGSPARFHRHLDRLVFDDRGGRSGFPPAVLAELAELRARYDRWVGPASRLGR